MTPHEKGHQAPHVKTYMAVFAALMFLTVVTVAVSYLQLPIVGAVFAALVIATLKASLVAAFFMHLRRERTLIYGLLALTFFFMGVLFLFPIADTAALSESRVVGENVATGHAGHGAHEAPGAGGSQGESQ